MFLYSLKIETLLKINLTLAKKTIMFKFLNLATAQFLEPKLIINLC